MEEVGMVLQRRFGDEQSTLLDQFERLSFEVQLNQAILARSLSEPGAGTAGRPTLRLLLNRQEQRAAKPAVLVTTTKKAEDGEEADRRRGRGRGGGSGLKKLWKKLLKPILGRKSVVSKETAVAAPAGGKGEELLGPKLCKAFSRSVRF